MDLDKALAALPIHQRAYYWGYLESLFFNAGPDVSTHQLPTEFFDFTATTPTRTQGQYVPFNLDHFLTVFADMDAEGSIWYFKLVDDHTIELACTEAPEGVPEDFERAADTAGAYIDRLPKEDN